MFWLTLEGEVVNETVDALTVTSNCLDATKRLASKTFISEAALVMEAYEEADGKAREKMSFAGGLRGWGRGSVRYGYSRDITQNIRMNMLQVTGELSPIALKMIMSYDGGVKCTRIDLTVDVKTKLPNPKWAVEIYGKHQALDLRKDHVKLVDTSSGSTLYINRRNSPVMGRVYDKSAAYGFGPGSAEVIRYELEIKDVKANRVLAGIKQSGDIKLFVRDAVVTWFRNHDVPISASGDVSVWDLPEVGMRTDYLDAKISYLFQQSAWMEKLARVPEARSAVRYAAQSILDEVDWYAAKRLTGRE
jgi:hypothetical protein